VANVACNCDHEGRRIGVSGSVPTANLLTGGVVERFLRATATENDNYLTDALGSTAALTGFTGNSQTEYDHAPYGPKRAAPAL
jgi:hypothetical protein